MNVDASVAAFALFLITLGVLALAIGVHDAALADASFGVTASAVFLIALALVLLVSAVQLAMLSRRRHWPERKRPPCKATVLIAFLLVIVVSVYVFFAAIRGSGGQRAIVVAISLALIAGAPLGLRFFGSEARVTLPRLGTIALGLVGTTLAAWQFWYQNEIAPAQVGRAVALDADLRLAGERRLDDVVRATASFQALTGESVVVVGSA